MRPPRVAYFPDSFHEVNGVAHTSRNFVAYAERRDLPFLCIHAKPPKTHAQTPNHHKNTTSRVHFVELSRSLLAVGVEKDLAFDPLFIRHGSIIEDALHRFQPDLIHLTGPSELGFFAAYFAHKLHIPLAASWHTNVHEYAASRLPRPLQPFANLAERGSLYGLHLLYSQARILFAPNQQLCDQLASATNKKVYLMQRGVDTVLFTPAKRTRTSGPFRLGFVGRLSVEKNVSLIPLIQKHLDEAAEDIQFILIGHGAEEPTLRQALPTAIFPGVLRGEALAAAYADMDLLIFPSHTDTFGNVVLEALASGVPAIVTPDGGPATIVRPSTGIIAQDKAFPTAIFQLLHNKPLLAEMRISARAYAQTCTWDAVFDRVYQAYESILSGPPSCYSVPVDLTR